MAVPFSFSFMRPESEITVTGHINQDDEVTHEAVDVDGNEVSLTIEERFAMYGKARDAMTDAIEYRKSRCDW